MPKATFKQPSGPGRFRIRLITSLTRLIKTKRRCRHVALYSVLLLLLIFVTCQQLHHFYTVVVRDRELILKANIHSDAVDENRIEKTDKSPTFTETVVNRPTIFRSENLQNAESFVQSESQIEPGLKPELPVKPEPEVPFKSNVQSTAMQNGVYTISKPVILTQGGEPKSSALQEKRNFIKKMMADAWNEYDQFAWGTNELNPISKRGQNGGTIFGNTNIGATIIDSLGTLYIMGFTSEFEKSRDWVKNEFNFSKICSPVSLFETNIRIVGGFLSAYALTSDRLFLDKAVEVGRLLLPAFDTEYGIPMAAVNPCTKRANGNQISLAEIGTLHLEFVYLSQLTKDPIFEEKVEKARHYLYQKRDRSGLYKNSMYSYSGQYATDQTSLGGGADSFYEYLMKSWIQTGDLFAKKMYEEAIDALIENKMMKVSKPSHLLYFGSKRSYNNIVDEDFSHLACFAGGMFALGASSRSDSYQHKERDLEIGKNITNTCHESYIRTKTKLGPENFWMSERMEARGYTSSFYILRPEVIESYFILYRITKDPKYISWGWSAALAIQRWCKAGSGLGYSGIRQVDTDSPPKDDIQPTFFLAETLKYLYLLFSSNDLIDLNYWVFNTEAHPLPIKGKNPMF